MHARRSVRGLPLALPAVNPQRDDAMISIAFSILTVLLHGSAAFSGVRGATKSSEKPRLQEWRLRSEGPASAKGSATGAATAPVTMQAAGMVAMVAAATEFGARSKQDSVF